MTKSNLRKTVCKRMENMIKVYTKFWMTWLRCYMIWSGVPLNCKPLHENYFGVIYYATWTLCICFTVFKIIFLDMIKSSDNSKQGFHSSDNFDIDLKTKIFHFFIPKKACEGKCWLRRISHYQASGSCSKTTYLTNLCHLKFLWKPKKLHDKNQN